MKAELKLKGTYTIRAWKDGKLVRERKIENLVVNQALGLFTDAMSGGSPQLEIDTCAIGTGTTAPTPQDTSLENQTVGGIQRAEITKTETTVLIKFFIPDATLPNGSYSEFGIFAGPTMFARSIIDPAFTKASGEDLSIDYQITLSATQ